MANVKRIDGANNESEYWKVINDISNPRGDIKWKMIDNGVTIE